MKEKIEKARKALELIIMYATEFREDDEIDVAFDAVDEIKAVLGEVNKHETDER